MNTALGPSPSLPNILALPRFRRPNHSMRANCRSSCHSAIRCTFVGLTRGARYPRNGLSCTGVLFDTESQGRARRAGNFMQGDLKQHNFKQGNFMQSKETATNA